MFDALKAGLRDAGDVLKHARGPSEVVRALLPSRVRGLRVLNAGHAQAVDDIDRALRDMRAALKAEAITDDGTVSYAGLADTDAYRRLEQLAPALSQVDLDALKSDAEKSAFWINLYNVLAIHGVVALGIRKSVMEVPSFFGWVAYRVGEHVLTLDDIEHGVLRANAAHPVSGRPLFAADDPRLGRKVEAVDPRIHAALVCASTSCPAVRFYEAGAFDSQLDLASRAYVAGAVRVRDAQREIELPITFRYFEDDFAPTGIRVFVTTHAEAEHAARIRQAFAEGYRVTFSRYDWSLNGRI